MVAAASVPGSPVVTVPIVKVGVTASAPAGPVGPVAPSKPSTPAGPVGPCGIVKSRIAASVVPELITDTSVPGSPVVTVPTVKVAAVPVGPVAPVGPVGPVGPVHTIISERIIYFYTIILNIMVLFYNKY